MSSNAVLDREVDAMDTEAKSEWPSAISIDRKKRLVELDWNGKHALLSHKVLRQSCRCSVCESTRRALNDVIPVAADIELLKMEVLGSIGIQLFFSDGHDRGIYPWAYLRRIVDGPVETGFTEALMKGWRDE
jgi:DUF971 family protein